VGAVLFIYLPGVKMDLFSKKTIFRLILFISALSGKIVFGQDLNYFHYSVNEGLPSSQVHDIIQDDFGNLWFATDQGISTYNGYNFKNYTTMDGLTDNVVFKFFKLSNGQIWCSTFSKSVFYFKGPNPVFKPYTYNKILTKLPDGFIVNSLHVTNDHSVFIGIVGGSGYIHIDSKGEVIKKTLKPFDLSRYEIVLANKNKKSDFFFTKPLIDPQEVSGEWDKIVFSRQKNKCDEYIKACYFEKSKTAIFTNPHNILILKGTGDTINIPTKFEPISLGKFSENEFWVGYRYGGVEVLDLSGKKINSFLIGKSVTKLLIDHEGGFWFSTLNDGVFHSKTAAFKSYEGFKSANTWVNSLSKDKKGNLCIGFYNGDVSVLKAGNIELVHNSTIKKPAFTNYNPNTGTFSFMTDNNLYSLGKTKPDAELKLYPLSFYVHKNESIIVASYAGIKILDKNKEYGIITGYRVNDVCFNKYFYLATNKGLYYLKNQIPVLAMEDSIVFASRIMDIEAWNTKLVLATKGSGVLIVKDKTVTKIDTKQGLSNNIVSKVYIENDSVIWACTNSGLNRIAFKNGELAHITIISNHDGLISNEVTAIEIINDTVWVGTRDGLCFFSKSILRKHTANLNYFLEINEFKVNDEFRDDKGSCELSYFENRIEFGFKAISFFEFDPIVYRFKLQGLENKWNYSKNFSIVYSSLPPGRYKFIVQARGNNSSWEMGEQSFVFTIHPPFWKTWWFLVMLIVLVGILIYLFFKFRILTYNRDITRELMRLVLKRLTKKTNYVVFREQGKDIRIATNTICYIEADGNYIDIHTDTKKYTIRYKIGEFLDLVPDPLEYLRINRSFIIRLDKVQEKSKKDVTVCGQKIAVGETYLDQLEKIKFKA
jgi:ligand-binding sensor domain-containing protein